MMKTLQEIISRYKQTERDRTFPFSEWQRKDIFERLVKDFLIILGYNPDQINYDDVRGIVELEIRRDLRAIIYVSSIQEEQRFDVSKTKAITDTTPVGVEPADYEIACVTNFEKWFFYFDGKEVYAVAGEKLEEEFDTVKSLLSRSSIESGKFKEVARKLLHKEDNEPLRQELNTLREKIADKILQEKTNIRYLRNPDGTYNNEILNEITTRWITRFLALKLAEDSGISFNFTLGDIRRSFELYGKTAKPLPNAKVKEETLSNAIRALMSEFERRYNGGIFMYEEGVDYITFPDSAFFDLLEFTIGWAFTIEDARIIGFVYERFLGQEIVVEEKKGKPKAVLKNIGEARGRRKAGGIYYTPKYIVDYIVENTLGKILNEKREEIENTVKDLKPEKFASSLRDVKNLKILDPACGSGSFLIKVLAEFKNFYEETKSRAEELKRKIDALKRKRDKGQMLLITDDKEIVELEENLYELKKEIDEMKFPGTFALRHNIYGVDLDPKAIDITAFTLMVQVYDELKEGARCPTMIGENLKVGNSLVSAIIPEEKEGFIPRKEIEEKFKDGIAEIIRLRRIEKGIDLLDDSGLRRLIKENFDDVVEIYRLIKERYPNAIPTAQQKLLDEWHKRARKEPIEKTFDVLITQTGLARIFLKEVFFEKIRKVKGKIEFEIERPLVRYFNSEKRVLRDKELKEILEDERRIEEEFRFAKDRAIEISKSQPPKVFNWEIEFPEVFFDENGNLKENPGFGCVVGNPPHGADVDEIKSFLISFNPLTERTNKDTGELFTSISIFNWIKNGGLFSMVLPKPLVNIDSWKELRNFLSNYEVKKVIDLMNAISGQRQEHICLVTKKHVTENKGYITGIARNAESKICEASKIPQEVIDTLGIFPLALNEEEVKLVKSILDKGLEIGTFISACRGLPKSWASQNEGIQCVDRNDIERYYYLVSSCIKLPSRTAKKISLLKRPKIIAQRIMAYTKIPHCKIEVKADYDKDGLLTFETVENIYVGNKRNPYFYLGILNSSFVSFYLSRMVFTKYFETSMDFDEKYIHRIRFPITTPNQQAFIISLVSAIIQKKKEYHTISQNIEDYIDFKEAGIIGLDEFLKSALDDFEVVSSLKAKHDNFDALRLRIEGGKAFGEYGIRRKVEDYEEIEEDEQVEVRGKYIVEWHPAGEGKIKDGLAVEFLTKMLEKEKRFSKAKTKTMWQKIAEVKVPEFTSEVKEGFLKYKSLMGKAKKLDEEIIRIDRAIDRLVYDLYGLTEDEIKIVEKSVWEDKFEEMYEKLSSRNSALKLADEVKE